MQNVTTLEPISYDPILFGSHPDLTDANLAAPILPLMPLVTATPWRRALVRKWDLIAILVLMLACAIYSLYALAHLTGL